MSEGLLKSGETDTEHGCEAEEQFGRRGGGGGSTDSASEKEGEAMAVRGTETMSVSVRKVLQDRSLCVGDEESEGRGLEFNSVCEAINTVALLVGRLTSSSSGSEFSCSDRGQNGSSTCRNTRVIILQTGHNARTHTLHTECKHPRKTKYKHIVGREEQTCNMNSSSTRQVQPPKWIRRMQTYTLIPHYLKRRSMLLINTLIRPEDTMKPTSSERFSHA